MNDDCFVLGQQLSYTARQIETLSGGAEPAASTMRAPDLLVSLAHTHTDSVGRQLRR